MCLFLFEQQHESECRCSGVRERVVKSEVRNVVCNKTLNFLLSRKTLDDFEKLYDLICMLKDDPG